MLISRKHIFIVIILLIVSCLAVYGRIAGNGFVNIDDDEYITENAYVQSGVSVAGVKWAAGSIVASNWHPLTMLSHMLDWSLFGDAPCGHHMVNLFLHIGSVLFLFFFLLKTTKNIWPSAFAAAFFALHPLRVESVAWAAERKDVLAMFFGMTCIYSYALYSENRKLTIYILSLILFTLSLMSKPMMVTLPFALLLLDYWPLKRLEKNPVPQNAQAQTGKAEKKKNKKRKTVDTAEKNVSPPVTTSSLLWEKVPFLMLSVISCVVTLVVQNKAGAVATMEEIPFFTRAANAVISWAAYLGKIFFPARLAVFYPYENSIELWQVSVALFILAAITAAALFTVKKMPFLFVGWFWYLGTFVPMIGLVQAGMQSMADRYTYLPSIGIAFCLAWGIPFLFGHEKLSRPILFPAGGVFLAVMALFAWHQCGYWKNSFELFDHAIRVTKNNDLAYNNRGSARFYMGQHRLALEDFNRAISLNPRYVKAYNNRGITYGNLGLYPEAVADFTNVIRLRPDHAEACYSRGVIYTRMGQYRAAIDDYSRAVSLKADYAVAYNNRGNAYLILGDEKSGCADARRACALGSCVGLNWAQSKGLCR